ncbi:unnamed protein product [Fusarium graminearum]|nr:unnamed protein product [Fusarium graminearum]
MIEQGRKEATVTFGGTKEIGQVSDIVTQLLVSIFANPDLPHGNQGLYIAPTVFESPSEVVAIYRQEIFGPVLVMKTYTTEEEVIRMANATEFGLMASVFTSNVDCAARMVEALEAGTVCVNTSMAISYKAPFGGQKQSGYGSEGGLDSVLAYTQVKTVAQQLI